MGKTKFNPQITSFGGQLAYKPVKIGENCMGYKERKIHIYMSSWGQWKVIIFNVLDKPTVSSEIFPKISHETIEDIRAHLKIFKTILLWVLPQYLLC